jgi:hypothetical protein
MRSEYLKFLIPGDVVEIPRSPNRRLELIVQVLYFADNNSVSIRFASSYHYTGCGDDQLKLVTNRYAK